ncbi:MAG: S41 family peptidase [Acidobacteria bacterium]|jgi:tricorn protease|nr:S41 family peptidase [Acidobacteriota bacterium]
MARLPLPARRTAILPAPAFLVAVVAAVFLAALAPAAAAPPAAPQALAMQPDLHGDLIAFAHAEDVWTVPAAGGVARRITFHEGEEKCPKFSPDGKLIAFTAEYDGNTDVYVMSTEGGNITRLTWHPGADEVVGWHPVSGKVLFRSGRDSYSRFQRLFLIAPDGSGLEALPLPEAGWGAYNADASLLAYTRVATEDRTWKRYRGGLAPDLYLYDVRTGKDRQLTDARGTERFPIWIGGTLYYQADPDGVLNLFAMDPGTGQSRQLTRYADFDAGRPSEGNGKIVYDRAGGIEIFDPASGQVKAVSFQVLADAPEARPYQKNVKDWITSLALSPDGNRAVVVARGEVFTVPREKGVIRNLSQDSGTRDKDAAWSPDGRQIAFFSDRTGEYEIFVVDPLGKEPATRLTTHKDGYRFALRWSPDSKKLAFTDQTLTLSVLDVATKTVTKVDRAEYEAMDLAIDTKPIFDHAWSPDSRFLAYTKMGPDLVNRVWIYGLETKQQQAVTGGTYESFGPVFSADGERLFFVSNRRFDPTYSDMDFELVYKKVAGIYSLALKAGAKPLFPPKTGDEAPEDATPDAPTAKKEGDPAKKDAAAKAPATTVVDLTGIEARVEPLPLPRGNYRRLGVAGDTLFYLDGAEGDFNRFDIRDPGARPLKAYDLKERKERSVLEAVDDYALSADGKRLGWRRGTEIGIVDASAEKAKPEPLDLSGLTMRLDPRAEWKQIYREVWRLERDYFYDPGMHGLDWAAVGAKYQPLIDAAASRAEVRWVIGELIGELATSHTYVYGGDRRRRPDRVPTGMLGADLVADPASGRWQIRRILRTPDWTTGSVPPLAAPGVDVREGDFLLAVDGRPVTTAREAFAEFEGLSGKPVRLAVTSDPKGKETREALVVPASDESKFRYLDWLERNRAAVEKASGGKLGYLHLPDTFTGAAEMFPQYWYGQTQKEGLVVDGRFNAGGLDPDPFLNRMNLPILFYWTRRYSKDYATPLVATQAHLAMLTNRQAGSGGDMLPAEFQLKKMGPVIGTRTWGGLVGVSMFTPLVDGGGITAPDYRVYSTDGKWVIENEGVQPDIVVDLDPAEMQRGVDAQLMKAVDYLMEKIRTDPPRTPPRPPAQTTR